MTHTLCFGFAWQGDTSVDSCVSCHDVIKYCRHYDFMMMSGCDRSSQRFSRKPLMVSSSLYNPVFMDIGVCNKFFCVCSRETCSALTKIILYVHHALVDHVCRGPLQHAASLQHASIASSREWKHKNLPKAVDLDCTPHRNVYTLKFAARERSVWFFKLIW